MAPNTTSAKPINPNEYLAIPKWINEEYFHSILAKDVPNYARVTHFTPIAATAPGENYTSIMVRVLLELEMKDGSTHHTSYILKTVLDPSNGGAAFVSMGNLFPKEKYMYELVLPRFRQLYKEAGVDLKFGPDCLHIEETPERTTLVLEDLKRENFVNDDRLKGLDMAHMTSVLHKLAEFHAVSAKYCEVFGRYSEMFDISMITEENRAMFEGMAQAHHDSYVRAMHEWGLPNPEYYIEKLVKPKELFDEAINLNKIDPNEFNVLNHGDFWVNNIMFKHKDSGEIDTTLFVDFQLSKWGCPAQDLWYFIISSSSLDIKVKEFDHFIRIYHQRLAECIKLLQYSKPIPSLKELHILMLKYSFWGLLTANGVMTAVLLPSDKEANMENMMKQGPQGEEFRYKTFTNPLYSRAMCQLYPFFDAKGVLDIHKNP